MFGCRACGSGLDPDALYGDVLSHSIQLSCCCTINAVSNPSNTGIDRRLSDTWSDVASGTEPNKSCCKRCRRFSWGFAFCNALLPPYVGTLAQFLSYSGGSYLPLSCLQTCFFAVPVLWSKSSLGALELVAFLVPPLPINRGVLSGKSRAASLWRSLC